MGGWGWGWGWAGEGVGWGGGGVDRPIFVVSIASVYGLVPLIVWTSELGRAITTVDNPPQNLGELRQALLGN